MKAKLKLSRPGTKKLTGDELGTVGKSLGNMSSSGELILINIGKGPQRRTRVISGGEEKRGGGIGEELDLIQRPANIEIKVHERSRVQVLWLGGNGAGSVLFGLGHNWLLSREFEKETRKEEKEEDDDSVWDWVIVMVMVMVMVICRVGLIPWNPYYLFFTSCCEWVLGG